MGSFPPSFIAMPEQEPPLQGPASHPPGEGPRREPGQGSADEVKALLARLVEDGQGSLELEARCARRIRDRSLLVDLTRLQERSLVRIAHAASRAEKETWSQAWIEERLDEALKDLLIEDEEADAGGLVPVDGWESPYAFLTQWFGIESGLTLSATVRFNGLAEHTRRVFFALMLEGAGFEECHSRGLGSATTIQEELQVAFRALFFLPDTPAGGASEEGPR